MSAAFVDNKKYEYINEQIYLAGRYLFSGNRHATKPFLKSHVIKQQ